MALQDIRLLRTILNDSLDALEAAYESKSLRFPSLDEPYGGNTEAELLALEPDVRKTIDLVISASYQILCTVRHPFLNLADASSAYHLSSCLRVAEKFNIPEVLKEAGTPGLNVVDIAKKVDIEPTKLARILRVLATHHIFREVRPDVFANNRISSYFSTNKTSEEIRSNPASKYNDAAAAAAGYIGTFTDDVFKASSYLLEDLEDKETGKGFSATSAALQKAMSTDQVYFSWLENAGNEYRFNRTSLWDPPETIVQAFDWASIPHEGFIVDVGGGLGAPSMILARAHPELQIVIQDRQNVVDQGTEHWKMNYPEALNTGHVSFMVHDFFAPQPVHGASVFLVRTVCHDWPDDLVVKILGNLRSAANSSTRLILADYIMPYACPADALPTSGTVHDPTASNGPRPLLNNLGKAGFNAYYIDITMQVLLNGQERTLSHHTELAAKAGWKVVRVNRIMNSHFGYLVAEPIS
ncbi:O-methyltransferase [Flammula alnicola]|nr:O-methyltransferase [Flammula alnicola]